MFSQKYQNTVPYLSCKSFSHLKLLLVKSFTEGRHQNVLAITLIT